jgi:hypothetical protein
MEKLVVTGKVKEVGVSNFSKSEVETLLYSTRGSPNRVPTLVTAEGIHGVASKQRNICLAAFSIRKPERDL